MASKQNKSKAATFAINAKHPHIEFFNMQEAQSFAKKDFQFMHDVTELRINNRIVDTKTLCKPVTEPAYVASNSPTIYLNGNVWLALMNEWSERAVHEMHAFFREHGFIEAIAASSKLADAILARDESALVQNRIYPVWADVLQKVTMADAQEDLYSAQSLRSVLEVLRFPKRYSPAKQNGVLLAGLTDFVDFNSSRKYKRTFSMVPGNPLPFEDNYFFGCVKEIVSELIAGTVLDHTYWDDLGVEPGDGELCEYALHLILVNLGCIDQAMINEKTSKVLNAVWGLDPERFELCAAAQTSSGATAELSNLEVTLRNKLRQIADACPWFKDPGHHFPTKQWFNYDELYRKAVVKAVPKSYKTPRIIAKEPTLRNYIATAFRKLAVEQVGREPLYGPFTNHVCKEPWKLICVDDQNPNRETAWEASVTVLKKLMATIDHSHASDSISEQLGLELFPLFKLIPWLRSSGYIVGDAQIHAHIFLSSGHPLTFLCETIVFFAIAFVVTDYIRWHMSTPYYKYQCNAGLNDRAYTRIVNIRDPRAFGDDLECDVRVVELYIQIAQKFGLQINVEKSFYDPTYPYRESCGVEYLNGAPMHGVKWPRTTFDWTEDSSHRAQYVKSLIDLQHHLYHNWRAQEIVRCFVLDVEPKMTHSAAYTVVDDLWSDVDRTEYGIAPTGKIKDHKLEKLTEAELASIPQLWTSREYHAIPQAHYPVVTEKDRTAESMFTDPYLEVYMYEDFLQHGPRYEDKLSELLGVTTPVNRAALCARPQMRWVRVRR